MGGPPSLTEYSRLNDFPGVLGKETSYGIGSATTKLIRKSTI
jgi:hypothetical protein